MPDRMDAAVGYEEAVALWRERRISTGAELALALSPRRIEFAYHSGKIENDKITYHDTREIFEHDGVTTYTGDLRTLFEIRNAREAHELFLTAFDERRPLDEALVKELHEELTSGTYDARRWALGERPGEYKRHDHVIGRGEVGAMPEDVEVEMSSLLDELRDVPDDEASAVLTAAAYLHAKFEEIHPFADGNGRTGRLVMNYFLVLHDHPPITIHEEDRKAYYDALEAWDEGEDLSPLRAFLREQTAKTWREQILRAARR
ncbi:MAG: Fic family protein [Synergistaceae bacterium]|nr:Fic family protein [Synergistaceae bacterium]